MNIQTQIDIMRVDFPKFHVIRQTSKSVVWEGRIKPQNKSYKIRITYCITNKLRNKGVRPGIPRVIVIDPILSPRKNSPEPIPHIYKNESCPEQPFLCLFHPKYNEWEIDEAIAKTIVPWTAEWLAVYEIWHATGQWTGGGEHPS